MGLSPSHSVATPPPEPAPIPTPQAAPLTKHFTALDGLRGVAVLVVVAFHFSSLLGDRAWERAIQSACSAGYLGVTLFFVLSGFLITRILVRSRERADYFPAFYARRSLRIFPLFFAYLAFNVFVYYPLRYRFLGEPYEITRRLLAYVFYVNNYKWSEIIDPGLLHLWSLAIEEQFYLVWPLVIYFAPRRWLIPICAFGCLVSLGYRGVLTWVEYPPIYLYQHTLTRIDALLVGAVVGIIQLDQPARERLVRVIRPILILSLVATVATAFVFGLEDHSPTVMLTVWPVINIFFASLIFWAATTGAENGLLNSWLLRTLGKYSYGIYVLHWLPLLIIAKRFPTATPFQRLMAILACILVTGVWTAISWYGLERPFLRLKDKLPYNT